MQSWDQIITRALEAAQLPASLPHHPANSLILRHQADLKIYSFFTCTIDKGLMLPSLTTVILDQRNSSCNVVQRKAEFSSSIPERCGLVDRVEVEISEHPSDPALFLVLFNLWNGAQSRRKLAVMRVKLAQMGSKEEILLIEVNMSKLAHKALWHPTQLSYFLVLSDDYISIFSTEGEEQGQSFDIPLQKYRFRQLLICEKVVDFFFWPGDNVFPGAVLACLTVTGQIELLQCIVPASVKGNECIFLGDFKKTEEIYLRYWKKISKSQPKDALSVSIIPIEKGFLSVKTTKKDEQINLEISYLQIVGEEFEFYDLIVISDRNEQPQSRKIRVHPQIVEKAFYYEYKSMLLRVDLEKHLSYIDSIKEKGIHCPSQVKVDAILNHQGSSIFLFFDNNYIRILRRNPQLWNFHSIPLLSIQLKCHSQQITSRLHQLFSLLKDEIKDISARKNFYRNTHPSPPPPAPFQPAQEEAAVEKTVDDTNKWLDSLKKELEKKESEVKDQFLQVDRIRREFTEKNKKKKELEDILIQIQTNNQEIDALMKNVSQKHPAGQKIGQILEMLKMASEKAAESSLPSSARAEFEDMAEIQLIHLKEVTNSLRKCEQNIQKLQ